jgi:uncharacterized protein
MKRTWLLIALAACGAGTKQVRSAGPPGPRCPTVEVCTRECEGGSPHACVELGSKYDSGDGVPTDPERALSYYRKACDGGAGDGCELAAATIQDKDKAGAEALYRRAFELYRAGCDAGDGEACGDLGVVYENGRAGVTRDLGRAAELYARGCEKGSSDACFFLGTAYDTGQGVAHSAVDAARSYERSCELNDPDACGMAANYFDDGSIDCDVDKARTLRLRGVELYEKQCDAGMDWGCWSAATDLDIGLGIPEDRPRAIALLRKGCERNGRYSCGELGSKLEEDEGRSEALAVHRKACDLGEDDSCLGAWRLLSALGRVDEAEGYGKRVVETREKGCAKPTGAHWCQQLGEMYEKGSGVAIDANQAVEYKRMAAEKRKARCLELGGYDCGPAAKAFSEGTGVKADPALAADLWKRACDGAAYLCTEAGDRFAKGKGVAADEALAARLYDRGCAFEIAQSCYNLALLVQDQVRRDELMQRYQVFSRTCEQPDDDVHNDWEDDQGDLGGTDGDPCADGEPYGD